MIGASVMEELKGYYQINLAAFRLPENNEERKLPTFAFEEIYFSSKKKLPEIQRVMVTENGTLLVNRTEFSTRDPSPPYKNHCGFGHIY